MIQSRIDQHSGARVLDCDSWDDFVTSTRNEAGIYHIFRGHAHPEWLLASELERLVSGMNLPSFIDSRTVRANIAIELDREFRERAVGFLGNDWRLLSPLDWMALGRQNGLITPLLDWTRSPFVAAYFAFVTRAGEEIEGFSKGALGVQGGQLPLFTPDVRVAVWALLTTGAFISDEFFIEQPLAFGNPRQTAQRGVYTTLAHRDHLDVGAYLKARRRQNLLLCWTIPLNELRTALMDLQRMNITPATLFPDLEGAARAANGSSLWGHKGNHGAGPRTSMQLFGLSGRRGMVDEGSEIRAYIGSIAVGVATAASDGWVLELEGGQDGDVITLTVDGVPAAQSFSYGAQGSVEVVLTPRSRSAGPANPMQVFGVSGFGDVQRDSHVEAMIDDEIVGAAIATEDGWVIDIQNGSDGSEIHFRLDGELAREAVLYDGFSSVEVTLTIP